MKIHLSIPLLLLTAILFPISAISQHTLKVNYTRANNLRSSENFMVSYGFQHLDSATKNTFESSVSFLYGRQQKDLNARDFSISLKEKLYFGPVDGFINIQNDQSLVRGIDNRVMGGVGLEKQILKRGGFVMSVSDGALFELTKFKDLGEFSKVRNSFRLQIRNSGKIKLKSSFFIQNNIKDWDDLIISSNTTLGMPVSKFIDLTANYMFLRETFISRNLDFLMMGVEFSF